MFVWGAFGEGVVLRNVLKKMGRLALILCLFLPLGCVQIEQTVYLKRDRSGTIVEVITFADRLVRASKSSPEVAQFMSKARAEERLAQFSGVELSSHEAKDLGDNGKRIRNVYSFKDINEVQISALPNRNTTWPTQKFSFKVGEPRLHHVVWNNAYYHGLPFQLTLSPNSSTTKSVENPRSAAEMEKLRTLLPYFRAEMRGFRIRLSVETFAMISGRHKGAVKRYDIFNLQDSDLSDDDTLLKALAWNRFPDQRFGTGVKVEDARGRIGKGGKLTHGSMGFVINLPTDIRAFRKLESAEQEPKKTEAPAKKKLKKKEPKKK